MWLAFSVQFTKGEEAKAAACIKKKDEQLKLKGNSNRADKKEGFVIGGVEKSYLLLMMQTCHVSFCCLVVDLNLESYDV
uniref:Uncharacterized protein n=1 Tax=Quercus lobata TaxID=97700 RepID=A0A7N2L7C6_QUELO